jgi:hypothetical protein
MGSYTFTASYSFMVWCLIKHRDNFTIMLYCCTYVLRQEVYVADHFVRFNEVLVIGHIPIMVS